MRKAATLQQRRRHRAATGRGFRPWKTVLEMVRAQLHLPVGDDPADFDEARHFTPGDDLASSRSPV